MKSKPKGSIKSSALDNLMFLYTYTSKMQMKILGEMLPIQKKKKFESINILGITKTCPHGSQEKKYYFCIYTSSQPTIFHLSFSKHS